MDSALTVKCAECENPTTPADLLLCTSNWSSPDSLAPLHFTTKLHSPSTVWSQVDGWRMKSLTNWFGLHIHSYIARHLI